MRSLFLSLSAVAALSISTHATASEPLLTVDIESYDALVADSQVLAGAFGSNSAMIEAQLQGMIGPGLVQLMDPGAPWHVALWLESIEEAPLIAIALPIADFAAFEEAIQTSMLGQMGAQYIDAGDRVVLYGTQPGVAADSSWGDVIGAYAVALAPEPEQTIELNLTMNEPIRTAGLAALERAEAQLSAVFQNMEMTEANGVTDVNMEIVMDLYFSYYKAMLRDLDQLRYAFSVEASALSVEFDLRPVKGSTIDQLLSAQTVELTGIASQVDWGADMCFISSMGEIPDSLEGAALKVMQAMMPLYGLEESVASEWLALTKKSLPFRSAFSVGIKDGLRYTGFYELPESPSSEVYEAWLDVSRTIVPAEAGPSSMYSEVAITRDYRKEDGHSVDLIELELNSEHPSMQMPEQKEMMERMFGGSRLSYEMALIGDRIYFADKGALAEAINLPMRSAPLELNANTRVAGSMNLIKFIQNFLAGGLAEEFPVALAEADSAGTAILMRADVTDQLETTTVVPLKLIEIFSAIEY